MEKNLEGHCLSPETFTEYFKIRFIHPTVPGEITGAVRCIAVGRSPIPDHRVQVKPVQISIVDAG
jgi:hypothetical protein